jgi:hypothetical protein
MKYEITLPPSAPPQKKQTQVDAIQLYVHQNSAYNPSEGGGRNCKGVWKRWFNMAVNSYALKTNAKYLMRKGEQK